jgi:hypothetical protein
MKELQEAKFEPKCIDLGERKISKMNSSHIVTIPKKFILCTQYEKITHVKLVLQDDILKLIPSRAKHGDREVELWRS